ncbi:PREDICTED: kinesin-4-like isoform X1 [Populus euphratica]|uniref:Kinesin-4-like isoform X1 n=1 Tax=Populus euphratica TaxID=75702 RepID=A0AAJ6U3M6_POPEU|nr:PREDICTED: kinesin-4-like isoform X1 [Populus euphratica]XP_011022684.1 PREDICTED: kinesin-4-like isoform X1 [Populus euphratica]XP_011022685.1 PREDICTED: kinesin-4-like isoform X1 [Populus euphratica]
MIVSPERSLSENGRYDSSNGAHADVNIQSVIEWLNRSLPHLNLPSDASEEKLRAYLIDGTVLCNILDKLCPGLVEMRGNSEPGPENIRKFLAAMDEIALPRFVLADIKEGYMKPVLQCLGTLKTHFEFTGGKESIREHLRRRWNLPTEEFSEGITNSLVYTATCDENPAIYGDERQQDSFENNYGSSLDDSISSESAALAHDAAHKLSEMFQQKQGSYADLSDSNILELMKSKGFAQNASTRTLFSLVNIILEENIERKNGHVHHRALILKKVVQVIEHRVSTQALNLKDLNNLYEVNLGKCQSRIKVLETLAAGTTEEIQVLLSKLQQIKIEKTKIKEKKKLEEQELFRTKQEKIHSDIENSTLKHELEIAKTAHEEHCLLLQMRAEETKVQLEKKLMEFKCFLTESKERVKELESFSESKYQRWKSKEGTYKSFIDYQSRALQELRGASDFLKHEILKTKRSYAEEFNFLGVKLKGLVDAAANYHSVLAENRRLYNEVQDLKGNIRVYCRIRPFLLGQSKKRTTVEYIGENGELVISNPSKQGKDSNRLFKFNKVFGQAATQEEVFLDTQPLIRSVLDGYNVCIFAYGQTGSGKTYTMSGPDITSQEDWGVNYRALHDLFQISQHRKSSILYELGVQMVEIYNEQVRDLLSSDGPHKRLGIWSTTQPNGLAVPDASMHAVTSTADVLELMDIGLMNRAVGATVLNERSSRSHSVLTVHVYGMDLETGAVLRGNLHLVDLAGSERVDRSEAIGERLREAQHINKSLAALGDVIFSLAQKSQHVPFRNSKLTQVLQSSLGGQAKTLMFVQLNPDVDSYSETISTLKFAERVSGIELGAAKSNKEGRNTRELMEQVAFLSDTISRKDEVIERLQQLKANVNGVKCGMNSRRYDSSSPRRHSNGTALHSPRLSGRKGSRLFEKASSDTDNCSEHSERRFEAGSAQSMDNFQHKKMLLPQSKSKDDMTLKQEFVSRPNFVRTCLSQKDKDDLDLLGFGDADSDERLCDISDGCLSRAETESSLGSAVEVTLFPESKPSEATKPVEVAKPVEAAKPARKAEDKNRPSFVSRLPKPSQKLARTRLPRLSTTISSASKASSSMSAARKPPASSFSATKPVKHWH